MQTIKTKNINVESNHIHEMDMNEDFSFNYYDAEQDLANHNFYSEKFPNDRTVIISSMVDYKPQLAPTYLENIVTVKNLFVLDVLKHLLVVGVKFDSFHGLGWIHEQLSQFPASKAELKQIKHFYVANGINGHRSGEFPAPSNLKDYLWMKYIRFSNDSVNYTLLEREEANIINSYEEVLYGTASEFYREQQYANSKKEAYDLYFENTNKSYMRKRDSIRLKSEEDFIFLMNLEDITLPLGATVKIRNVYTNHLDPTLATTDILLTIDTYSTFLKIVPLHLYRWFCDGESKYGSTLTIEKQYEDFFSWEVKEEENKKQLTSFFEEIIAVTTITKYADDMVLVMNDLLDGPKKAQIALNKKDRCLRDDEWTPRYWYSFDILELEIINFFMKLGLEGYLLKNYFLYDEDYVESAKTINFTVPVCPSI